MARDARTPWNPDRLWADPLIALLVLLTLLASGATLLARQQGARRPAEGVSLQGRLTEVILLGPEALVGAPQRPQDWDRAERALQEPWDRALLAVLKAERNLQPGAPADWIDRAAPPDPAGAGFRRVCLAAFGQAPPPDPADRSEVFRRLGSGPAARLLEARLQDREGRGGVLRAEAEARLRRDLLGLGLFGLLVLLGTVGGLVLALYLLATARQPLPPMPAWGLSGRAAALVFLLWFAGFFLAGQAAAWLLFPWPAARWMVLPLGTTLHALLGLRLLTWAEGLSLRELWRRVAPGRPGRDLAWGIAFLALAVFLVVSVALLTHPLLKPDQSPQRDLQTLLRGLRGWGPNLLSFLTVAGLAPCFEELLFRGFLLPVLARGGRRGLALVLTALLFGAIHLQPAGLPVLGTLGLALGLALRQTGSLRTPILVHACWNGSLFLLLRAFA